MQSKHSWISAAVLGAALSAFAQEEQYIEPPPPPSDTGEDGARRPDFAPPVEGRENTVDAVKSYSARPDAVKVTPSGDEGSATTHTVNKGDTLWDLSQKYLGSPWYWPKVWSYNPNIANPHWIYPGNQIRFSGVGEELPAQVQVAKAPGAPGAVEIEGDSEDGLPVEVSEDNLIISGQIGYVPKSTVTMRVNSFLTPEEVESSGVIAGSFQETHMLSFPGPVYVDLKSDAKGTVKLGDVMAVYRTGTEVVHPVTHEHMGFITRILGLAKVVRMPSRSRYFTVHLVALFDEINRGDLVGTFADSLKRTVALRKNERSARGLVVSATNPDLMHYGEHHTIIVDIGADDGIQPGNTLTIIRQHDASVPEVGVDPTYVDDQFPLEEVGTCLAMDVKSRATTCLLLRSIREIVSRDRVEMVPEGSDITASR